MTVVAQEVTREAPSPTTRVTGYLRVVSQQDETLHYVHGIPGHGEHLGHEVTVALEEGDGPQLDVEQQRRHSGKRLQVFLSLVGRGSDQRLQTLRLNCHLEEEYPYILTIRTFHLHHLTFKFYRAILHI